MFITIGNILEKYPFNHREARCSYCCLQLMIWTPQINTIGNQVTRSQNISHETYLHLVQVGWKLFQHFSKTDQKGSLAICDNFERFCACSLGLWGQCVLLA